MPRTQTSTQRPDPTGLRVGTHTSTDAFTLEFEYGCTACHVDCGTSKMRFMEHVESHGYMRSLPIISKLELRAVQRFMPSATKDTIICRAYDAPYCIGHIHQNAQRVEVQAQSAPSADTTPSAQCSMLTCDIEATHIVTYAPRPDASQINEWMHLTVDPKSFDDNRLLCVWHAILEAKRLNTHNVTPDQYFDAINAQRADATHADLDTPCDDPQCIQCSIRFEDSFDHTPQSWARALDASDAVDLDSQTIEILNTVTVSEVRATIADIERVNSLRFLELSIYQYATDIAAVVINAPHPLTARIIRDALNIRGWIAEFFVSSDCVRVTRPARPDAQR